MIGLMIASLGAFIVALLIARKFHRDAHKEFMFNHVFVLTDGTHFVKGFDNTGKAILTNECRESHVWNAFEDIPYREKKCSENDFLEQNWTFEFKPIEGIEQKDGKWVNTREYDKYIIKQIKRIKRDDL